MVLHADERGVIQQENEGAGVRVTEGRKEGRKDAALCFHSTWRVCEGERQEKVK